MIPLLESEKEIMKKCCVFFAQQNVDDICGETDVRMPSQLAVAALIIPKNGTISGPKTCVYRYTSDNNTILSILLLKINVGYCNSKRVALLSTHCP